MEEVLWISENKADKQLYVLNCVTKFFLFPKNIIEIMTGQVEKRHEVMYKYIVSRMVKLKGHMFFIWLFWLIFQTAALLSKQETLIF